jgi:hypothetical protein
MSGTWKDDPGRNRHSQGRGHSVSLWGCPTGTVPSVGTRITRILVFYGSGGFHRLDGTDYYDNGRVLPPSHEGTKTHQERLCDSWWLCVLVVRTGFGRFSPPSHEGTKTHDDNGTTDSFTAEYAEDTEKQKIKLSSRQDAEIAKNSPTDVLGGLGDSARYHCVGLFRRLRCLRW